MPFSLLDFCLDTFLPTFGDVAKILAGGVQLPGFQKGMGWAPQAEVDQRADGAFAEKLLVG